MGIFKRSKRVEDVGWRLLKQVLGLRSSRASDFYEVEIYTNYSKSSEQLYTHPSYNDQQSMGHRGIFCELIKSRVGGSVGTHTIPYCGHRNISLPGRIPFVPHADVSFFSSNKSLWRRAFATQRNQHNEDELDSDVNLSSSDNDAMDSLSSEDDTTNEKYNSKTIRRRSSARTNGSINAFHCEEDTCLSESDAMGNKQCCDDDRTEEENAGGKRGKLRSSARAIAKQEEKDDDEDEFQTSSLLDFACDDVNADNGDKRRPLWLRVEEGARKDTSELEDILETWSNDGYPLDRSVIVYTITVLRKRRKYQQALELSDWVMTKNPFELNEMDYGIRVELIGKLQGAREATEYFGTIPKQFQTSMAYSLLLTVYVDHNQEKDALSLINKVDGLGLEHRTFMYNQLLQLYKKNGLLAGVAEVLESMDEKGVVPDIYTYNTILDLQARKGNADGMEKVRMQIKEDENVVPDAATFAILAKGYIRAGLNERAKKVAKKLESSPFGRKRVVGTLLIKLYGQLGHEEDLERVWKLVEGSRIADYIAMIRGLGKLGNVGRAEDIFKEMMDKMGSLHVHQYNALLSVYANKGSAGKGESLLKRMERKCISPNPGTYNELVLMYLKAGEEEKAMGVLQDECKLARRNARMRPMHDTFFTLLEWFAGKGDVHNAETVIKDLRGAGYKVVYRSYVTLLKAYTNAGMRPYGLLDRIRGDKLTANQLIRKKVKMLGGT